MKEIKIKKADQNEIYELQKISQQTFSETFSSENTEEDMSKYLKEVLSLEKLTSELNNKNSGFYFATHGNKIVGYLKLNFGQSQTELKDHKALEIERIYVLQEFHGKCVGQLLYEKALEIALQIHATYIWLGVWEKNSRAIGFYERNGFVEFDKHVFILGNDEQTDIMMKLQLENK